MLRRLAVLGIALAFSMAPAVAQDTTLLDEAAAELAGLERPFDRYMAYQTQYRDRLDAAGAEDPALAFAHRILAWEILARTSTTFHQYALDVLAEDASAHADALYYLLAGARMNGEAAPVSGEDMARLGASVTRLVSAGMPVETIAGDDPGIAELLREAVSAHEDGGRDRPDAAAIVGMLVDLVPPTASPALAGPAGAAFTDALSWSGDMWGATADGVDLVADAIERGELDMAAYDRLSGRLESLARTGPWDSDTASGFLREWAEEIPGVGKLVDAVWPEPVPDECKPINCDCDSLTDWGILAGEYIRTCRAHEEELVRQCRASGAIVGSCHPTASGDRAFPKG